MKVTGGPETARALSLLGRRSSEAKVLRQALRPGAREMVKAVRANASDFRATGATEKAIAVGILKKPGRSARLMVGHRLDQPEARWRLSHILEFGSRFVSGHSYVKQAADSLSRASIESFGANIWQLIAKEATRVASRAAGRRGRRR